jgi:hypothetical protein
MTSFGIVDERQSKIFIFLETTKKFEGSYRTCRPYFSYFLGGWLMKKTNHNTVVWSTEPEILNLKGAQESIPGNRLRQHM